MFVPAQTAARIEAAEAALSAGVGAAVLARGTVPGAFVEPVGGGMAVFAGPDSPVNKVIGAGFSGPPDESRLDALERRYAALGAGVQAEISTLADPAWHATLSRRGYVLAGFENVLGFVLSPHAAAGEPVENGVQVTVCAPDDERRWIEVIAQGFAAPDDVQAQAAGQDYPRDAIERVFGDLLAAGGFVRYLARIDGTVAGGASLRVQGDIAQFCGAATLPAFRRRGVQTALYTARIREAAAFGCTLAIVTTAPGSKSMENAQRRGFVLLYARAIHMRPPA